MIKLELGPAQVNMLQGVSPSTEDEINKALKTVLEHILGARIAPEPYIRRAKKAVRHDLLSVSNGRTEREDAGEDGPDSSG